MSTLSFWPRRLRWRLLGAWRWPLFLVLTVADGFIAHALPPNGARAALIPAMVIASFANLFLIGLVAPWLARRIVARQGERPGPATFPPANHVELLTDRIAAITLVLATIGLVFAGLGNRKVVLDVDAQHKQARLAAQAYVDAHAPAEIKRNFVLSNTHDLQESGLFRICTPFDDRRKAWCMYVDVKKHPATIRHDGDSRPNGQLFPGESGGEGF